LTDTLTLSDAVLLQQMKNGDQEAFSLLYQRYFAQLSRFAFRRLQNETVTEELVMDVFFELWQQRATLYVETNLSGWLHGTLRNKALHELRARAIREKHLDVFASRQQPTADTASEKELDARLLEQRMQQAINRLSPQCRQAFTLSRYEHLSYTEIAYRMHISVKTVEKHIGKAIGLLKKEFKDYPMDIVLLVGLIELAMQ
jgi:RNA polymerase sigma-70 factor, ECF subfamily